MSSCPHVQGLENSPETVERLGDAGVPSTRVRTRWCREPSPGLGTDTGTTGSECGPVLAREPTPTPGETVPGPSRECSDPRSGNSKSSGPPQSVQGSPLPLHGPDTPGVGDPLRLRSGPTPSVKSPRALHRDPPTRRGGWGLSGSCPVLTPVCRVPRVPTTLLLASTDPLRLVLRPTCLWGDDPLSVRVRDDRGLGRVSGPRRTLRALLV